VSTRLIVPRLTVRKPAGVRQGGILSPVLFAVYIDPLITVLKNVGHGCSLQGDFYRCLLYADDVLLLTHTLRSMQTMRHICDKFAENFDIKFNSGKSVAMRIGSMVKVVLLARN